MPRRSSPRTPATSPKPKQKPLDQLPDLLTPEEFMVAARIGRTASYELLRAGGLPVIRLGRQIRIPRSVLLQAS